MCYFFTIMISIFSLNFLEIAYADKNIISDKNISIIRDRSHGDDTHSICLTPKICEAVEAIKIPVEDLPPELKNCDPVDYFYGINGHKIDYVKARKCALNTPHTDTTLNSYQILEMIYANGYGTKRDINLAAKIACENEEPQKLILALDPKNYDKSQRFNVCTYATDPNQITMCGHFIPMKVNQNMRDMQIKNLIGKWAISDKNAFKHLEEVKDNYVNAYIEGEVDLSVYEDRVTYSKTDELNQLFFNQVMDLINGKFPQYSDAQFVKLDQQLNQVYKKIMTKESYSISHEGIRKSQRAWLKYRDAWIAFTAVHYPNINANSMKAWLTKDRVDDLSMIESCL